jgi:hypothetical protein
MDRPTVFERLVDASSKAALSLLAVMMLGAAIPARASLEDAVNWARRQGCAAPARQALRDAAPLHQAALQMAAGVSLHDALSAVGYVASQSSAVHLSGALNDAQAGRLLAGNYCKTLADPAYREMGVAGRSRDLWLVLAAPVALPSVRDAALINRQILNLVNQARAEGRRCGTTNYGTANRCD